MKRRGMGLVLLLSMCVGLFGQYTKEFKRIFFDAGYLYETDFYEEAFNRYKNLLTLDPGNANILFRCGMCCLDIPGNEAQAVTYLEEASKKVSPDYKDNKVKETNAPVRTWFMLGKAHHLNGEFDLAMESYQRYLDDETVRDPLERKYTKMQMEACVRAAEVMASYPSFEFQNVLDRFDEDLPSCNNPVISGAGDLLVFLVDYPNDRKIMMTEKKGEYWTRPRVINSEIGMVGETFPSSLSYDGTELYLVHQFYSHSDIFLSRYENGRWTEAEALGSNINGRTSESHASISRDGQTLYYTSNTRGSLGSYDIFVSHKDEKGEWGPGENLGSVINTEFEEQTPFISGTDSILFFSSQGHPGLGGMDVFFSELQSDGTWGPPSNIGYPVNNSADNLFFNPGWNELDGYYAVRREEDPTNNMINMVIALEPPPEESEEVLVAQAPAEEEALPETPVEEVESVIEPEETDEIHEALNSGLEADAETKPVPPARSPVPPAGSTSLQTTVPFEHNAYELSMAAMLEVEKVADLLQRYPEARVKLTGRADETGSADYNLLLSHQRVDQIASYLSMRGVEDQRMETEAKGETDPVALNRYPDGSDAPLGRYLNRQVSIHISNKEAMQGDLSGFFVPPSLRVGPADEAAEQAGPQDSFWFTIQVFSSLVPISEGEFGTLSGVEERACTDGYYRYVSGEYRDFGEARQALEEVKAAGYPDAFIQTLEWFQRATR